MVQRAAATEPHVQDGAYRAAGTRAPAAIPPSRLGHQASAENLGRETLIRPQPDWPSGVRRTPGQGSPRGPRREARRRVKKAKIARNGAKPPHIWVLSGVLWRRGHRVGTAACKPATSLSSSASPVSQSGDGLPWPLGGVASGSGSITPGQAGRGTAERPLTPEALGRRELTYPPIFVGIFAVRQPDSTDSVVGSPKSFVFTGTILNIGRAPKMSLFPKSPFSRRSRPQPARQPLQCASLTPLISRSTRGSLDKRRGPPVPPFSPADRRPRDHAVG